MPSSEARSELVMELAEEFLDRYRKGERPSLKEYVDRYPELAAEIQEVFPAMAMMENIAVAESSLEGEQTSEVSKTSEVSLKQLGDYRIIREIGHGGMGVVYEAEQVSLGRHVALKVLPNQALQDAKHKRRFEREARAAAKLHHTNIVPVFGVGEHEGLPYYVMQFIQGLGLDAVLDELNHMQRGAAHTPTGLPTGGEIRIARREVSAANMARSLMAGAFQPPADSDKDAEAPEPPNYAATEDLPAEDEPAPRPPLSASSNSAGLSESFTVSSSSITLPGSSADTGHKGGGKKQTYWQSVANIGRQVADALEYAHKQGVLHRDVKPSNLLLDLRGTVWVTDFGLAKVAGPGGDNLTHTGDILGTLRYMPPEAFEGKSDARGDVYSLGLTLYELLAMRPAFDERDRNKLIRQVTSGEPTTLDRVRRDIPRDLVTIIQKSIAREPSRRYATAEEMASDLQRFLDDEPIQARRQTQLERYWRWARHNPGIAVLGGVLTAVLVLATVISLLAARHFNQLHLNEAEAAQSERNARHEAELARQAAKDLAITEAEANALAQREKQRAEKARTEAEENRNLLRVERDQGRQKLYFAEMTLAGIGVEAPAGLGHVKELLARWGPAARGADLRGWEWFYLDSQARHPALTLRGHNGPVRAVAYTRDGKRLATGGEDTTVRIWDATSGREISCLRGHTKAVHGVAWSPDGNRLATASKDGTALIWDVASGLELQKLCRPGPAVTAIAWQPDGARLATTGHDFRVRVWNVDTGQEVIGPTLGTNWGMAVAWSPDGKKMAFGSWNQVALIIDGETGAVLTRLRGHTHGVLGVNWSPSGEQLATASFDGTVRVWDPGTGKEMAMMQGAATDLYAVCWSPDGKQIAAGGGNKAVQIWDADTTRARTVLRGNLSDVLALAWSPDGASFAATAEEGVIRVWDVRRGSASSQEGAAETGFDWARDGRTVTRDGEGTVRVWEPASAKPSLILAGGKRNIGTAKYFTNRVRFSPDGAKIAAGGDDNRVRIWDAASGNLVRTLNAPTFPFRIDWSPDGTRIACSGWGWGLAVWDVQTGDQVFVHNNIRFGQHYALAWSPAGDRIATAGFETQLRVWDSTSGRMLAEARPKEQVWDVTWSPDGRQIASAGWDGRVSVWHASTGSEVLSLGGHSGRVMSIGWSPDGKRIASGSTDRTVKLWDAASGQETLTLRGYADTVTGVHWHPDGCRLATRDGQGNVLYWDATPGFMGERSPSTLPELSERIRHDPADTSARRLRAEVLARRGDWDAAAVDFAELARLPASAGVYPAGWWALAGSEDRPPAFPPPADAAPARWLAPAVDPNGFIALPADGTTAVSRVFAPRRMMVALDIGPVPPVRLWLNEKAIGTAGRGPILVELNEGWNSLAVRGGPGERFVRWRDFDKPADNGERLAFARAAARAVAGQGKNELLLDDAAKAKICGQALAWLKAELAVWTKQLESGPPQGRSAIVKTLSRWQRDTDFAGIRDKEALDKLSAEERKAFTELWADVEALLRKAEEKPK